MYTKEVTIVNPSGLHARPASDFVAQAEEFDCEISIARPGEEPVDAKSIVMLLTLEDSSALGPSMATALITTLYGVLLANLVFSPLAKKLSALSAQEVMYNEMILEGILSIQDGENPRMIRDKLESFISSRQIEALDHRLNGTKPSGDKE